MFNPGAQESIIKCVLDDYSLNLIDRLSNPRKWYKSALDSDFIKLTAKVNKELRSDTISGKIASIFIQHQIMHEIIKDLIGLATLYVQGEIWPAVFQPPFDGGKDKMTGWYISYYEDHCIGCKGKAELLKEAKKVNNIRNKVAHNLSGKNEVVIRSSYQTFGLTYDRVLEFADQCEQDMTRLLEDLNARVEWNEIL